MLHNRRLSKMKIPDLFGVSGHYASTKEQLFGLELEIESVDTGRTWSGLRADMIVCKDDHSLRNNGREFITNPVNLQTSLTLFQNVHTSVHFHTQSEKFSPRTSIHVHVNCQPLEASVVRQAVLLYALFEEAFFAMVAPDRRDNIHCVPLTETHLSNYFRGALEVMASRWHKYTALNLIPLRSLGTIEFRHMQGHDNPVLLRDWLMTLEKLMELAANVKLSAETLTEENIDKWFKTLFSHTLWYIGTGPLASVVTRPTLINVKLGFI